MTSGKQYLSTILNWTIILVLFSSCTSTLYVAPKQADCSGVALQKCYLIRKSPTGNWIMHYQEIQDFNYELGFSYRLKVKRERVKSPPMDAGSYYYSVVEVVDKQDVTEDIALEDLLGKEWKLEYLRWKGTQFVIEKKIPTLSFKSDAKIAGNAGCNNFFGSFTLDGRTIRTGDLGSTKMMCQDVAELEQAFLQLIGEEMRAIFSDGKLVVYGDSGNKMIFHQ